MIRTHQLQVAKGSIYDEGKSKERYINRKFFKVKIWEKKRVGSAVQGIFFGSVGLDKPQNFCLAQSSQFLCSSVDQSFKYKHRISSHQVKASTTVVTWKLSGFQQIAQTTTHVVTGGVYLMAFNRPQITLFIEAPQRGSDYYLDNSFPSFGCNVRDQSVIWCNNDV